MTMTTTRGRRAGALAAGADDARGRGDARDARCRPTEDTPVSAEATAEAYDWRAHWYPVAYVADVEADAPLTFTLLGEPLAFWRDKSGEMRCVADRCPHRLVPLSEGRVNETGELECGVSRVDVYGRG